MKKPRQNNHKVWKKPGLIIGALFLLYVVLRPYYNDDNSYIKSAVAKAEVVPQLNSQTLYLPQPVVARGIGGGESAIQSPDQITIYVVHQGDTLSEVSEMFGVSQNTIIWANDLPRGGSLRAGQRLVILPVSGIRYTVAKGETLLGIALKHKGDVDEIKSFNGIKDDSGLRVGEEIIIPDGEESMTGTATTRTAVRSVSSLPNIAGYYADPLPGHLRSQGLHGHNGIDLTSACHCEGASVLAVADGDVIISRSGGWNGGYGNYVVISHNNGTQTLYAHLQRTSVSAGTHVSQGQVIGTLGNTGKSTGPHLHLEVRGARNPF